MYNHPPAVELRVNKFNYTILTTVKSNSLTSGFVRVSFR